MGKIMAALGVTAMFLAGAAPAEASGVEVRVGPVAVVAGDRVGRPLPTPVGRPYYMAHGARFSGGYYYPGRHHAHWAFRVWDPGCGRYHYYDPYLRGYYYYDRARLGYYPVTAILIR
jgi:hypothetical protein